MLKSPAPSTSQIASKSPSEQPVQRSSPFGFLSVSSVYSRVNDFSSDEEEYGILFQHDLEDGQASRMQGDGRSQATSHVLVDPINAGSMPVRLNTPISSSRETIASDLDIPVPGSAIPDRYNTPICDHNTLFPDHPDTPIPDRPDATTQDIVPESHEWFFNPSDSDSDDAVPPEVTGNAEQRRKAAVPREVTGNAKSHRKAAVPPSPVPRLSEELNSDDDGEGLKGGPFSGKDVEKIKAEYAAFDKHIAALAREMGRSVNSIQKIGGRVSRVVNPRKTTAWNVFQSSYPANTDESLSQADYTKNMVRPAYNELVKKHGGEDSEEWAAESARMIMEYTETKASISTEIAKHGGDVAKVIATHKKAWKKDFQVLAGLGVHCELTVLSENASSPAAHAQHGQLFGTAEIESYYKSRRDFASHVGDAYTFILSAKAGVRDVEEHKARVSQWEREEAFKNPNKTKGKVSKMLIALFGELLNA